MEERTTIVDQGTIHPRNIFAITGQIISTFKDDLKDNNVGYYLGTGTVVCSLNGYAFLITCAHNFYKKDLEFEKDRWFYQGRHGPKEDYA